MLNLTAAEITDRLAKSNEKIKTLKIGFEIVEADIAKGHIRKANLIKKQEQEEKKIKAAEKALILVWGIPAKVSQIRNQLLRKMERAGREDITVAENKNLRTEIENLKTELQKVCSHPFVYDEPGYEGSPSHEYENRHPGVRYCVVCGFLEETYKSRKVGDLGLQREYLFKNLTPDDKRIIQNQPWTSEGRKRVNVWVPLGAALKPFEESVARILNE